MEQARTTLNLKAIQLNDPLAVAVVFCASHAALYELKGSWVCY